MGNRLFQEARDFVEHAEELFLTGGSTEEKESALQVAKNALSSAYANSTFAEQEQLRDFQKVLDRLK
ncbi:DUF3813 domain-containing protein [Bacillus sp. FJAT-49732]|uniref:DUF3813 domain-containing protein n=1 Tax=Lederbergia citrisecunda TaxID=2833583 RepID=A0A942TM05_9BACI|nr:DUF3813 domain-containing protein [Lederbergia citrisecunda]